MCQLCIRGLLWWLALAGAVAFAAEPVISESQIKAAFLYNFTKFIEWPDATLADKRKPLTIGVLGNPELAVELESIVEGRKVNGHAIVVRNVDAADDLGALQILFVSAAEDARFASLRSSLADAALLTVGESPEFASAGGAITFLAQDGKLRFEINMTSAERARLKVSAELQKLAASVKRDP